MPGKIPDAAGLASVAPGDILDTTIAADISANRSVATLRFQPSDEVQTLEVGGLIISSVQVAGVPLMTSRHDTLLELTLPASDAPVDVRFEYEYPSKGSLNGAMPTGFTYLWPYWCGNVFPCRSAPSEGSTFHLSLTHEHLPVLYPREIPSDAPSYMVAWTTGDYAQTLLGTTSAGTRVYSWRRSEAVGLVDPQYLAAAFDWLEQNIGRYRFGSEVGSVTAPWGARGEGGIEHHPYWQVGEAAWGDESLHVHEAAHGWFGNGVRLQCWEDFVLSEGTSSYLAARALEEAGAPALAAEAWTRYEAEAQDPLVQMGRAWPDTRCSVDILDPELRLTSRLTYAKGALFYRAVEARIGRPALDLGLRSFYERWAGQAASVQDLLDVLRETSGYDPNPCARSWLAEPGLPGNICP